MIERMENILNNLVNFGTWVDDYGLIDGKRFSIKTKLDHLGIKSYLQFEERGDVVGIEFIHIIGLLDCRENVGIDDLANILMANTGSFKFVSSYVGLVMIDDLPHITLNSAHLFLLKWTDKDIADALQVIIMDFLTGLPHVNCPMYKIQLFPLQD